MKNNKGIVSVIIFAVVFFIVLLGLNTTRVAASDWYYTDDQVMSVAPEGINIGSLSSVINPDGLFVAGKCSKDVAPVIENGRVVKLGTEGNPDYTEAIWSNNTDNYLDINQKQTISMWIYMGSTTSASQGLVFVLQNGGSDVGVTDSKGNLVGGETIGVWGDDKSANRLSTKAVASTAIQNSWALEFDTMQNGEDTAGAGGPGNAFDDYQVNWVPQRRVGPKHIAWGYPGDPATYFQYGSLLSKYYYLQNHQDPEESEIRGNKNQKLAWHHVLIKYTPPTDGTNNATLQYKVNDKNLNGITYTDPKTTPVGQEQISKKINLNLDEFHMTDTDKLRFGFVTSSANENAFSGANTRVVFESIPGLVQADTNAYLTDKNNSSKVIETDTDKTSNSTPSMFANDTDQGLVSKDKVHPNDDLTFKYLVNYKSGRVNIDNANVTISLPDNVKFTTDPTKKLGVVKYSDGSTQDIYGQTPVASTDSDGNPVNSISFKLDKDLDIDSPLASIELYGQAADIATGGKSLHVGASHAQVQSDQFIADLVTKEFDIVAPADTLKITKTSTDPSTSYLGQTATLTADMEFGSKQPINNDDMNIHYAIDGTDQPVLKDTLSNNGSFSIDLKGLKSGKHTIDVYVVDPNYVSSDGVSDTITSNRLTYTVNVDEKKLQIASDSDSTVTAVGNDDVGIDGTHSYNDNSSFKNETLTLHTVINGTEKTQQLSGTDDITSGKFTSNIKTSDLNIGDNPVKIYMTDSNKLKSNELDFNVKVPNTTLKLTPDLTDITALYTESATLGGTISYSDDAIFKNSDITLNISVDGGASYTYALTGDDSATINKFNYKKSGADLGVGDHTIKVTATDGYGRSSDPVTYNVKIINKSLKLDSDKGYSFKSINTSPETRVLPRSGAWDLKVESINSKWALSAQCTELKDTANQRDLAGGLIYMNKNGAIQSLEDSQVLLASDKTISQTKEVTDIAGQWSKDNGILLKVMPSPLAGNYTGTISWSLTDSVQ
ncbi:hypothetical protein [Companilactobacillus nodensis]|uniref:Extracellular protein n=1 Tax=Companilactobacillus nodensis DSM 19682 = JCM 14932 = NBRC 107160 TaxID=1423775 RepID=A0A0R1K640_9LACO|nr:hypothetical protein [Companilactobacillus nodensis]KRK79087.1 hypothetical protein FD03_GL001450 [Companilactobacillus nodensis DSM 19682 = JCM 14932 = NBRC 107160]